MASVIKLASLESGTVSCSVCLEHVTDAGERSIAKLKCGHQFHLDCIGSAFNAKGSMQCPNCRHVEEGRWLYANGSRSHDDFSFEDMAQSYEDEYEVYAGIADILHPHHELLGHFQWCPYQNSYANSFPHFSVTLEEIEPPTTGYPDADVIINVLYGDHGASPNGQHVCPYLASQPFRQRRLDEQLVVVQNQIDPPSGGPLGGNIRGPQSFPVHERTGWAPQPGAHIPPTNAVGMINDVGLSSLPIDRFRWSAPANRSDAVQPSYNGQQHRAPENSSTSWHGPGPCPQHGWGASNPSPPPQNASPRYGQNGSRRSRHRGYATSSSSSATSRPGLSDLQRPPRGGGAWGNTSLMGSSVPQDVNYSGGVGWHSQSHQWRRDSWGLESQWRPWFQTTTNAAGTVESTGPRGFHSEVYGQDALRQATTGTDSGHYYGGQSGFPGFSQAFSSPDGHPDIRPFMQQQQQHHPR